MKEKLFMLLTKRALEKIEKQKHEDNISLRNPIIFNENNGLKSIFYKVNKDLKK